MGPVAPEGESLMAHLETCLPRSPMCRSRTRRRQASKCVEVLHPSSHTCPCRTHRRMPPLASELRLPGFGLIAVARGLEVLHRHPSVSRLRLLLAVTACVRVVVRLGLIESAPASASVLVRQRPLQCAAIVAASFVARGPSAPAAGSRSCRHGCLVHSPVNRSTLKLLRAISRPSLTLYCSDP